MQQVFRRHFQEFHLPGKTRLTGNFALDPEGFPIPPFGMRKLFQNGVGAVDLSNGTVEIAKDCDGSIAFFTVQMKSKEDG